MGAVMADTKLLLGKRIRYLRRLDDLSQEDLAEKAGVSHKYLGEIERGKANLTIDIAEKIANALNIEMTDLFDYKHEIGRQELEKEINALIREAGDENLQKVYRVLKSILK
jgi:transcriptional regulator with XRE-family HTH domain